MQITLEDIHKTYTVNRSLFKKNSVQKLALNGVTLNIDSGECVGLIGLNGAGKSTLIKILSGVLTPTQGAVMIDGSPLSLGDNTYKQSIGVLFGHRGQLWADLSIMDSYKILRQIYQVPKAVFDRRLKTYIERFKLADLLSIPLRKLSLGQRMKCEIVGSLLHEPRLLLLDEATLGLDLFTRDLILREIEAIQRETQMTLIFTSHNMNDIERTCRRLVVLDQGQIIYDGHLDALVRQYANHYTLRIECREPLSEETLQSVFPEHIVTTQRPQIVAFTLSEEAAYQVGDTLDKMKRIATIERFSLEPVPFETVIKNIYGDR
ncbi:ATP-binding cassette domain-containing protein [Fusibacter sp. JL298sf-3]